MAGQTKARSLVICQEIGEPEENQLSMTIYFYMALVLLFQTVYANRHLQKCTKAIRVFTAVAQEFCLKFGGQALKNELEDFIKQCLECQKSTTPPAEPMLETPLPNHP